MSIITSLRVVTVPVTDLTPHPDNPRRGDVDAIARSLRIHGQFRPLLVQADTNIVIAGNHTLYAALRLGWTKIAVIRLPVDDAQARRIMLADNRLSDVADYDRVRLTDLLSDLAGDPEGLDGTGYDDEVLTKLLEDVNRMSDPKPMVVPDPEVLITIRVADRSEAAAVLDHLAAYPTVLDITVVGA